jgi:MFS family permease
VTQPLGDHAQVAAHVGRPTTLLSRSTLVRISLFWLGLTSIDAVVNAAIQTRLGSEDLVDKAAQGRALAVIAIASFAFAIAIQPTAGAISDYVVSRWGRRKPFIVFGACLDLVFLMGIAAANTFVLIVAFVVLLQFSTNVARGSFQGYVPDLVPDRQVGLASSMVGLMQVIGNVLGFGLAAIAGARGSVGLAIGAIAVIEFVTMLGVVLAVPNGPPAKPRGGRSWWDVARETWATDILRERSYLWLLASRLFILMGGASILNFILIAYLPNALRLSKDDAAVAFTAMLALASLVSILSIVPASRLSDRIGRKPVIYGCTAIGATGLFLIAIAPGVPLAVLGACLFGASQGTFLAVDWALMTDIIPRASAGRYMGLSNVVTASSTTITVAIGGLLLDFGDLAYGIGTGVRLVYLLGVLYFVIGALALRPVVEPGRTTTDSSAEAAAA